MSQVTSWSSLLKNSPGTFQTAPVVVKKKTVAEGLPNTARIAAGLAAFDQALFDEIIEANGGRVTRTLTVSNSIWGTAFHTLRPTSDLKSALGVTRFCHLIAQDVAASENESQKKKMLKSHGVSGVTKGAKRVIYAFENFGSKAKPRWTLNDTAGFVKGHDYDSPIAFQLEDVPGVHSGTVATKVFS